MRLKFGKAMGAVKKVARRLGKKKLILLGIVAAYLLVLAVIYSPGFKSYVAMRRATQAATSYMEALAGGDIDRALTYVKANNVDRARSFLEQAAPEVAGTAEKKEAKAKRDTAHVLFSLTNEENKFARVSVKKADDGWKVVSFEFSENEIPVLPTEAK